MTRPRVSLKSLLAFVAALAAGLTALIRPNYGWAHVGSTLYLALLLTAILGVLFRRGERRAYWSGFAIFGWAWAILSGFVTSGEPSASDQWSWPLLAPTDLATLISNAIQFQHDPDPSSHQIMSYLKIINNQSCSVIAISLLGLISAWQGGLIARRFSRGEIPAAGSGGRPGSSG